MRVIAFDTETHLIRPGCPTPKMVCLSFAEYLDEETANQELGTLGIPAFGEPGDGTTFLEEDGERLIGEMTPWRHPKSEAPVDPRRLRIGLRNPRLGVAEMRAWLLDPNVTLVGHNTRFDLAVCVQEEPSLLPLVFQAYEEGRILDTMVRQQLCDIATGELKFVIDYETGEITRTEYGLDKLAYRLLGRWLAKADTWRLKYMLLDGVPLTQWPEEAVRYALLDAIVTLDLYQKQEELADGPIPNSSEQHKADWALYLMSTWGVRTDPNMVLILKADLEKEYAEKMAALRPSGLFRISPARVLKAGPRKGTTIPEEITKNMKEIRARVEAAYRAKGLNVPMTDNEDAPQTSTNRETLKGSGDPDLIKLAEVGSVAKLLQTYVPILEGGTVRPINCRYSVLMETGRTSCSGPNLQNMPRG